MKKRKKHVAIKKVKMFSVPWIKDKFIEFLIGIGIFLLWCIFGIITIYLLQGMELVREAWFIPYEHGSYMQLSGVPRLTLPWIVGAPFGHAPNSILVLFWLLSIPIQIFSEPIDYSRVVSNKRSQGTTVPLSRNELIRKKLNFFLIYSTVLAILCIPGLRTYEILKDQTFRYKHYFDIHEQSKPLVDLREFTRHKYGKRFPAERWKMTFQDGTIYKLDVPPDAATLNYLLQLPQVKSNVIFRDGKFLYK